MGINKNQIRQAHLEQVRGPISRPSDNPIRHVMGPGSKWTQDVYGDSFANGPITPSRSDVLGAQAAPGQGLRLRKRK